MKNKLKIFLCVVMILVFSFGTCATAYAYTGQPTDIDKAWNIVKSYWMDNSQSANGSAYIHDNFSPVLLYSYAGKSYLLVAVDHRDNYSFLDDGKFGYLTCMHLYSFDDANMYSKPTCVHREFWGGSVAQRVEYLTFDNFNSGSTVILGSKFDILNPAGEKVFQKGTSQSPNPTTPDSSIPGSNTLSTMFNKNSAMLNGVLQEIIALLPLLLPVLISFLAIRKGIKFTLQTLRSA